MRKQNLFKVNNNPSDAKPFFNFDISTFCYLNLLSLCLINMFDNNSWQSKVTLCPLLGCAGSLCCHLYLPVKKAFY